MTDSTGSVQLEHRAIDRWRAIDWWFNQRFGRLYDLLLTHSWGKRLRRTLPHIQGPRVLEVSFGVGFLMSQYAHAYEVTGLEYNPRCIEATRRRLERLDLGAKLVEGDAQALPFPDASFDTVINTDAFTLYHDPHRVLSELLRVLASGGRLVVMEYDYPRNGNLLGRLWVLVARRIMMMPRLDLEALHRSSGSPYQDYDVGGFGAFHMYVSQKPLLPKVDRSTHAYDPTQSS